MEIRLEVCGRLRRWSTEGHGHLLVPAAALLVDRLLLQRMGPEGGRWNAGSIGNKSCTLLRLARLRWPAALLVAGGNQPTLNVLRPASIWNVGRAGGSCCGVNLELAVRLVLAAPDASMLQKVIVPLQKLCKPPH